MKTRRANIMLIIAFLALVCIVGVIFVSSDGFQQGFKVGVEEGRKKVLMTDVGSAENRGSDAQYESEEFRHNRRGLLGSQLMYLLPDADKQLENQGYVVNNTKEWLKQIFDELEIIATVNKNEREMLFIEKQRKKYGL